MSTAALDNLSRLDIGWPTDRAVYLTLDFECDYGTALTDNTYQALDATDRLVRILETNDIPLTCFVQTEVLDERPETVELLRNAGVPVSFHPHSHTHKPRTATSVAWEVETSTQRFRDFFGESPTGYRLPNGNVRAADYEHLAAHDYDFDASVFPSWRPGHFDNTAAAITPEYFPAFDLAELPFTVFSERVRVPTALSYLRLAKWPFRAGLALFKPAPVIFNVHMHDLMNPPSFDRLSKPYQFIYARNNDGFGLLDDTLARFASQGYTFDILDRAADAVRTDGRTRAYSK